MNITINPPFGFSEIGQRQNNEDFLFPLLENVTTNDFLFLVCDGVGGAEKGEVASQLAAETISEFLLAASAEELTDKSTIQNAIETTLQAFDKAVLLDENKKGMATTLTLWLSTTVGIWLSHIGDSRIYHIRNNTILYQSKDHTLINQLLDQEIITPEEAAVSTQKNVISRAIQAGQDRPVKAESFLQTNVQKGDYFLLCSDGVLEFMTDEILVSILQNKEKNNTEKLHQIKEFCKENNTKDNNTAYLIELNEVSEAMEVEINEDEPTTKEVIKEQEETEEKQEKQVTTQSHETQEIDNEEKKQEDKKLESKQEEGFMQKVKKFFK
jgi:protein phosphatase